MQHTNETPILLENTLKPIKIKSYQSEQEVVIRKMKLETIKQIDNICKKKNNRSITNEEFNTLIDLTNAELDHVLAQNYIAYMVSKAIIIEL
jgi:hypothetical protein